MVAIVARYRIRDREHARLDAAGPLVPSDRREPTAVGWRVSAVIITISDPGEIPGFRQFAGGFCQIESDIHNNLFIVLERQQHLPDLVGACYGPNCACRQCRLEHRR